VPETDDLLAEVKRLRQEQEDHGEIIEALLRHSGREVREEIMRELAADDVMAEILLLVDGVRSQGEILDDLQSREIPQSSAMTVSRRFQHLSERRHLISLRAKTASGNVYRRTKFERTLGIVRELQRTRV
jgi:arginine repressor